MPSCAAAGGAPYYPYNNGALRHPPGDPHPQYLWSEMVGRPNWNHNYNFCSCNERAEGRGCLKCSVVSAIYAQTSNYDLGTKREGTDNTLATTMIDYKSSTKTLKPPTPLLDQALVENSMKGWFGWSEFDDIYIPFIYRGEEKYTSTRILESPVFRKYDALLEPEVFSLVKLSCWSMHNVEVRLFNEINNFHCDGLLGKKPFSLNDALIKLDDAIEFNKFLKVCKAKLCLYEDDDKCGFMKLNGEAVVPFVTVNGDILLPTFYFEGEVAEILQNSNKLTGWDLVYLKFCCKAQRIREELYDRPYCEVVSLNEIKKHFPANSTFEKHWPKDVAVHFLLKKEKSKV